MEPKTLNSKFEHLERMQIVSRMYVRNKFTRKDILGLLYTDIEMRQEMSVGHVGLQGWVVGGNVGAQRWVWSLSRSFDNRFIICSFLF